MGLGSDSVPVGIDMFGVRTYLADSMQFMLEYACRFFDGGAYYLMPSFRGEATDERHLSQFYHAEAEVKGDLDTVIKLVEDYIKYMTKALLEKHMNQIEAHANDLSHIENLLSLTSFPVVEYRDAMNYLSTDSTCFDIRDGVKLINSEGEKRIMQEFGGVVWVMNYEAKTVPFYQALVSENSEYARCADLLLGVGEVVGCGQRHTTSNELLLSLNDHGVPIDEYRSYDEMKRSFPLQTAGFGMRVERYMLWLLRHDDIRDCQLLTRANGETHFP